MKGKSALPDSGPPARTGDVKLDLILAAEKCFALLGFASTSLKIIQDEAGQRNASAIHYHFGSREGLIRAVLDYRMPSLDARRVAMMESARKLGDPALREIVGIWISPLAEELRPRPTGNYYLRFLEQIRHSKVDYLSEQVIRLQSGYASIFDMIYKCMPPLPTRLLQSRLAIGAELLIYGLSRLEAELPATSYQAEQFPSVAIANLADFITGGLTAPAVGKALDSAVGHQPNFHFTFYPNP
ncbi:transcriptional regulator, TetR family [Sphingobium faniae]|nr:transcriptional regulator, TetR family [Sphingobium faniae]